jgi:hypothetical protein
MTTTMTTSITTTMTITTTNIVVGTITIETSLFSRAAYCRGHALLKPTWEKLQVMSQLFHWNMLFLSYMRFAKQPLDMLTCSWLGQLGAVLLVIVF